MITAGSVYQTSVKEKERLMSHDIDEICGDLKVQVTYDFFIIIFNLQNLC